MFNAFKSHNVLKKQKIFDSGVMFSAEKLTWTGVYSCVSPQKAQQRIIFETFCIISNIHTHITVDTLNTARK